MNQKFISQLFRSLPKFEYVGELRTRRFENILGYQKIYTIIWSCKLIAVIATFDVLGIAFANIIFY